MHTKIPTCTGKDIHKLNDTKQYTLISTQILRHVLTDDSLPFRSSALWILLYDLSRFTDDFSVTISMRELALIAKRSYTVIKSSIRCLSQKGYITITNNSSDNKNNRIESTYCVVLPMCTFELIMASGDRGKITRSSPHPQYENNPTLSMKTTPPSVGKQPHPQSENRPSTYYNNKKEITTNKRWVFPLDFFKEIDSRISKCKARLSESESELSRQNLKYRGELNKQESWELGKERSALELDLLALKNTLARLNLERANLGFEGQMANNVYYIFDLNPSTRPIPHEVFDTFLQKMGKLNLGQQESCSITNEAVFSVRFGKLVKNNKSDVKNSVEHGLNIALGLIKDQRWETPKDLNLEAVEALESKTHALA